jgi:AcrR family transcriptional regulator
MGRAAPLQPEERKAAIIAATERLIVAEGGAVSTRAIAKAAGIAEGTIFRVFPTKEAIIDAIFADAFSREPLIAALAAIDLDQSLEARMEEVVAVIQRRMRRMMALFAAVGFRKPPAPHEPRWNLPEIAAVLEPDADRLRLPTAEAARMIMAMVMAIANPMFGRVDIQAKEIVDLVLNGITQRPQGLERADG